MMNRIRLLFIWLLCIVAAAFGLVRMLWSVAFSPARAWLLFQSHDQLANAADGGDVDVTLTGSDLTVPVRHRGALFLLAVVGLLIALDALLAMLWMIVADPRHAWVVAVAFDQLANAAANGSRTETISSRAHRARGQKRRWGCLLCKVLDWIDKNHCARSAGI